MRRRRCRVYVPVNVEEGALRIATAVVAALSLVSTSLPAHAFCGFYVSGSNKKMYADATQVVLMRSGTRTILSMKNDYRGPIEDFAMVVPVPVVLKDTDVRVLPKGVLERIDSLGSPRLVEYWEQDPCPQQSKYGKGLGDVAMKSDRKSSMEVSSGRMAGASAPSAKAAPDTPREVPPKLARFSADPPTLTADAETSVMWSYAFANQPYPEPTCTIDNGVGRVTDGLAKMLTLAATTKFTLTCSNSAGKDTKELTINVVKIEAQFDVAEYKIVILSATESTGLDNWLKLNNYKIPEGAEPLLRPYVESGSKFFVAKVDPKKVQMVDGRAELSPLRVQYDAEEFSLPIRLGLANSSGKQDLIVNILSPDKRYEVSNYKNVFIPTNIDVKANVKERFAEFYAALFDKTLQKHPGAVVTEYAWTARAMPRQIRGGGGGRMPGPVGIKCDPCPTEIPLDSDMMALGADVIGGPIQKGAYVLTRLHARYGKKDMKDDLRFQEAKHVAGGREVRNDKGVLETGTVESGQSFFQARYAIRYPWTGAMKCKKPTRNVWGGPPPGKSTQLIAAKNSAYAPRGKLSLAAVIRRDLPEIGFKRPVPKPAPPKPPPAAPPNPAPTKP
jgi:hypothetical protein